MQAVDVGKATVQEFSRDDMPTIAAGIAYHTLFSIPPLLLFVVAMAAAVNQFSAIPVAETLRDAIRDSAPQQSQQLLLDMIDSALEQVSGTSATIGGLFAVALALWSGSNAFGVISRSFNRAYYIEETRGFVRLKGQSILLTLILGTLAILAAFLLVSGQETGSWIADKLNLSSAFELFWTLARIPLALTFLILMLTILYWFAPNVRHPLKFVLPGAILATIMFALISFGIRIYLSLSDPGSAYGAASGIVILLLFTYFIAMSFTLGAELNSVMWRRYATPEMARAAARTMSGPKPRPTAAPPTIAPPEPYNGGSSPREARREHIEEVAAAQGRDAARGKQRNAGGRDTSAAAAGMAAVDTAEMKEHRQKQAVDSNAGAPKAVQLLATVAAVIAAIGMGMRRLKKTSNYDRKHLERQPQAKTERAA